MCVCVCVCDGGGGGFALLNNYSGAQAEGDTADRLPRSLWTAHPAVWKGERSTGEDF